MQRVAEVRSATSTLAQMVKSHVPTAAPSTPDFTGAVSKALRELEAVKESVSADHTELQAQAAKVEGLQSQMGNLSAAVDAIRARPVLTQSNLTSIDAWVKKEHQMVRELATFQGESQVAMDKKIFNLECLIKNSSKTISSVTNTFSANGRVRINAELYELREKVEALKLSIGIGNGNSNGTGTGGVGGKPCPCTEKRCVFPCSNLTRMEQRIVVLERFGPGAGGPGGSSGGASLGGNMSAQFNQVWNMQQQQRTLIQALQTYSTDVRIRLRAEIDELRQNMTTMKLGSGNGTGAGGGGKPCPCTEKPCLFSCKNLTKMEKRIEVLERHTHEAVAPIVAGGGGNATSLADIKRIVATLLKDRVGPAGPRGVAGAVGPAGRS